MLISKFIFDLLKKIKKSQVISDSFHPSILLGDRLITFEKNKITCYTDYYGTPQNFSWSSFISYEYRNNYEKRCVNFYLSMKMRKQKFKLKREKIKEMTINEFLGIKETIKDKRRNKINKLGIK